MAEHAPAGLSFLQFAELWGQEQGLPLPPHHRRMADWLEQRWRGGEGERNGLLMAFRSSGKSTLVGQFCGWVLAQDPDTRILVMAADQALARKMVRTVKRTLERHPATAALIPAKRDQWAADAFTILRPGELRDPSMLARGIGGNITGSRAELVVCDDVEVPKTCATADLRQTLRERLAELDYVLVPGGMQLYIGTPHSWDSLYAAAPAEGSVDAAPFLAGFSRLEIPLLGADGQSVWPDRFTPQRIAALRLRSGPAKFASQMQLQAVPPQAGRLDASLLRPYDAEPELTTSGGQPVLRLGMVRMVSASCCWDPAFGRASGDGSVIACVFCDAEGGYWLHRVDWLRAGTGAEDEDAATSQCRQVARFLAGVHVPSVRVETNGLGQFLPGLLRRTLAAEGVGAAVLEIHQRRPKEERILAAFDAPLAAGRLHVHRRVLAGPLMAELRDWRPGGRGHDDGLDAVAACLLAEPLRLGIPPAAPVRPHWRGGGGWQADTGFSV